MLFDKIIYINLDRRADRNKNVIDTLKKFKLLNKAERLSAIDGKKLDLKLLNRNLISDFAINDAVENKELYTVMTMGGIGCALSHYIVYNKIIDEGIDRCLILEDDIEIPKDFFCKISKLEEDLDNLKQNDFDLLFLGYHKSSLNYQYDKIPDTSPKLLNLSRVYGLFGYIVSLDGARKLLNIFPLDKQIDSAISDNSSYLKIIAVPPKNKLIFSDESDIHTKFGTDIQLYEHMNGVPIYRHNVLLMVMIAIVIVIVYKIYLNKN